MIDSKINFMEFAFGMFYFYIHLHPSFYDVTAGIYIGNYVDETVIKFLQSSSLSLGFKSAVEIMTGLVLEQSYFWDHRYAKCFQGSYLLSQRRVSLQLKRVCFIAICAAAMVI